MSRITTIRKVTRLASPLLYASTCVAVFVTLVSVAASTAVVRLLEAVPGGSYLFENTVLSVSLLLFACTLMIAVPDLTIYRLEGARSLGARDHVRHCALLYAGIAFVFVVLLVILNLQAGMLQYGLGLTLCAVAAYGILVDAGIVFRKRRLTRAQPRGAP